MDSQDDPTDSSAADAAETATSTDQSDEKADETGGFIFNNSPESDSFSPEHEAERIAEREQKRIVDLVRLQPTKNAELQDEWKLVNGSAVHQYLESQLKEYYHRDNVGYIRATPAAEEFTQRYQDVTELEDNSDAKESVPDLQRRDLVIALVTLMQELGHLPSADEINEHGEYGHQRYRAEFGDLFNAYQAAGILPDDVTRRDFYGGDELKSQTEGKAETERESGSVSEPEQEEKIAEPEGLEENASVTEPVETDIAEIDIGRPDFRVPEDFDDADLIGEIQRFADIIEEPPTEKLVKEYGRFPIDEYQEAFGSWENSLEAAGFDPTDLPDRSLRKYTNVEVLDEVRAVANDLGHPPTLKELGRHANFLPGLPSVRFGSLNNALEIAGLDPSERPSVQDKVPADSTDNKKVDDNTTENKDKDSQNDDSIGSVIDDTVDDSTSDNDEPSDTSTSDENSDTTKESGGLVNTIMNDLEDYI